MLCNNKIGKILPSPTGGTEGGFVYDYFIKDHLGNVRVVLTEEQKRDMYPAATMETAQSTTEESLYANLPQTRVDKSTVPGYPTDNTTSPNDKIAKIDGSTNKIGPSIVLKVMAGDTFNIKVSSWYRLNGSTPGTPTNPLEDLLAILNNGVSHASGGKFTAPDLNTHAIFTPSITKFFDNRAYESTKPKAYLNWILFDEQFKMVSSSSGAEQVGDDQEFKAHVKTNLPINKNGYLYVYVSNETPNINVFFDNLQITHTRGPILEETHYYPFGLTMAGISSQAAGGVSNKKKYNGIEFDQDLGLESYEAFFRNLDPQTGRWWQVDPETENMEMWSPYASNYDNPIIYNDPLGNEPDDCCKWLSEVYNGAKEELKSLFSPENLSLGFTLIKLGKDPKGTVNDLGQTLYNGSIVGTADNAINNPKEFGSSLVDGVLILATDKFFKVPELKSPEVKTPTSKSLGNPFKSTTLKEVKKSFEKRVKNGTMEKKGPNAYKNTKPKSGYSYNVDEGGNYGRGGKKIEKPHIDVNYPNPKPKNVPPKKKLDIKSN